MGMFQGLRKTRLQVAADLSASKADASKANASKSNAIKANASKANAYHEKHKPNASP
jgi:hypothetical protein